MYVRRWGKILNIDVFLGLVHSLLQTVDCNTDRLSSELKQFSNIYPGTVSATNMGKHFSKK